ncbi:hypothetical protein [Jannaschia rubra]|uniref:Uncharacterized protein n=1 Tax=Jannaschia rubra TaxID=282197 RepID=A0A0M6XNC7_9RHOB|nr:hypothetical protein [Jannaschia rubra]CTQ32680.1 hypothetical protein JAN5088_01452 [Jannaschia rubra]SFF87328.1 hypothetical protein SAMN04488517_101615 [Jannaschia rubra]
MPLLIAVFLFSVFVLNVVLGSTSGRAFLGNVGEMLMLLGASVAFVVAILRREAAADRAARQRPQGGQDNG